MAQQQTDANARSAFFEWLAQNVSPACLSDLYVAATDLETYCVNKKFLNEPIFEVSDAATIDRLRVCLSRDKIFKLFNRKKETYELIEPSHMATRNKKASYSKTPVL